MAVIGSDTKTSAARPARKFSTPHIVQRRPAEYIFFMVAGMSLVPLADAFNHKAAVVRLTADYAVEGASSDNDDQDADGGSPAESPRESGADGEGGSRRATPANEDGASG